MPRGKACFGSKWRRNSVRSGPFVDSLFVSTYSLSFVVFASVYSENEGAPVERLERTSQSLDDAS